MFLIFRIPGVQLQMGSVPEKIFITAHENDKIKVEILEQSLSKWKKPQSTINIKKALDLTY